MMRSALRIHSLALAALLLSFGCGGGMPIPSTVPVSGSVTTRGKPAPGMRVKFHPQFDIGAVKFIPFGETGPEGRFTLNTGSIGNGAPAGDYVVTIEKPRVSIDTDGLEGEVDDLKGKYSDPQKSQFKVTLKSGENVVPPFDVE